MSDAHKEAMAVYREFLDDEIRHLMRESSFCDMEAGRLKDTDREGHFVNKAAAKILTVLAQAKKKARTRLDNQSKFG